MQTAIAGSATVDSDFRVCACVFGEGGREGRGRGGQSRAVWQLLPEAGPGRTLNVPAYTERARRIDRMLICCCHRSSINGPSPDSLYLQ